MRERAVTAMRSTCAFAEGLRGSRVTGQIVNPFGCFSDATDFLLMAKKGSDSLGATAPRRSTHPRRRSGAVHRGAARRTVGKLGRRWPDYGLARGPAGAIHKLAPEAKRRVQSIIEFLEAKPRPPTTKRLTR